MLGRLLENRLKYFGDEGQILTKIFQISAFHAYPGIGMGHQSHGISRPWDRNS